MKNCGIKNTRGVFENVTWLFSGVTFFLIPKCPMCVAGWIAAVSGVTLTFAEADIFRGVILVFIALLFCLCSFRKVSML